MYSLSKKGPLNSKRKAHKICKVLSYPINGILRQWKGDTYGAMCICDISRTITRHSITMNHIRATGTETRWKTFYVKSRYKNLPGLIWFGEKLQDGCEVVFINFNKAERTNVSHTTNIRNRKLKKICKKTEC